MTASPLQFSLHYDFRNPEPWRLEYFANRVMPEFRDRSGDPSAQCH